MQPEAIRIAYRQDNGVTVAREYDRRVVIGRQSGCDIQLLHDLISRQHVEIYPQDGHWYLRDLDSVNGTLIDGRPVRDRLIDRRVIIELGEGGEQIQLQPVAVNTERKMSIEQAKAYYFEKTDAAAGEQTQMIREAYRRVRHQQQRRQLIVAAVGGVVVTALAATVVLQQRQIGRSRDIAIDLFYDMKSMEVALVNAQVQARKRGSLAQIDDLRERREELRKKRARYQNYLDELERYNPFGDTLSAEDQLILEVAYAFGECELELSAEFVAEVKRYIGLWQQSNRLNNGFNRMRESGYRQIILDALREASLPEEFIFLPLQESGYRSDAIGPQTRFGVAKGAWQFMPETAEQYGLAVGPKSDQRIYDEADERFDFEKSTRAASKYLGHIYSTEAQASGLLVLASYNWGDTRVRELIRKLPENPRERNFRALIERYRIPQETYDYVFYIFSAAVIARDPALFGFDESLKII